MLKRERRAYILHQINLRNKVLSADLSEDINVPDDTIHRDLFALAEVRKLIKFHGVTLSTPFYKGHLASRDNYSYPQKRSIAQTTASLIPDRMFVTTGGGTTSIEMGRAVAQNLLATFLTGSTPAPVENMNHPATAVIAMEGNVSKKSKMTTGHEAIFRIRGINRGNGVLDDDWKPVEIQKAMVSSSRKQLWLTDAKKMNAQQPLQVCVSSKTNTQTTEHSPDNPCTRPIRKKRFRCYDISS